MKKIFVRSVKNATGEVLPEEVLRASNNAPRPEGIEQSLKDWIAIIGSDPLGREKCDHLQKSAECLEGIIIDGLHGSFQADAFDEPFQAGAIEFISLGLDQVGPGIGHQDREPALLGKELV
jgi:hypothetical protein